MNYPTYSNPEFDEYAAEYDAALAQGLSASGENRDYFAHGRIEWLRKCLSEMKEQPASVMDFGCGTGAATPFLFDLLGIKSLCGVDTSEKSLEVARRSYDAFPAQFKLLSEYEPGGHLDMVFCNGVFHHIPLAERETAVNYVYRALRPGGLFAFWENNPWNPGTRYVMSRIPFDRDAITLKPREARRLLSAGDFEIVRTDFLFIFPRALRWLRGIEASLSRWPLGAQYLILCRKPLSA